MSDFDRLPPANVDAEEAVLGSLLIDPDALYAVQDIIKPDDFYREKNRYVFKAIAALDKRNEPADLLTVADELRRQQWLEEVGGESYIIGLLNIVPTSMNAEAYAKIVRASAIRRRLLASAAYIANMAYDETEDIDQTCDNAEQLLYELRESSGRDKVQSAKELASAYIDYVEEMRERGGKLLGLPTGFLDIDRLIGGMADGDLITIAGRPSMGKTALLMNIMLNAMEKAKDPITVLFFSLEMSAERLFERAVSTISRIDSQRLRIGDLTETEWPQFYRVAGELSTANLFIDDTPGITPNTFRSRARRIQARYGLDLIGLDYLQLMQADGKEQNRVQEMSRAGKMIKAVARELRVPAIMASQLNRGVEGRGNKRPMLSDLRDSGTIEEDSDQVWLIYRDDYYNDESSERPNIAEINLAKHRNGPTGIVDLFWQSQTASFRNLERQNIQL